MNIRRSEFLGKIIRLILMSVLAFIALFLGTKAVKAGNCNVCQGSGICNGLSDCELYAGK